MAAEWYYAKGDKHIGPISEEDLRQLAISGQLLPVDMVWESGMPGWAAASSIHTLFPKPASGPPPLPPAFVPTPPSVPASKQRVTAQIDIQGIGGTHPFDRIDVLHDGQSVGKGSISGGVHLIFESSFGHHTVELRQSSAAANALLGSWNNAIGNCFKNTYPVMFDSAGLYTIRFKSKSSWLAKIGLSMGNTLPTEIEVVHSPHAKEVPPVQITDTPEQGLLQKGLMGAAKALQTVMEKAEEANKESIKQRRHRQLIGPWVPIATADEWVQFTEDGAVVFSDGTAGRYELVGESPEEVIHIEMVNGTPRQFKILSITSSQLVIAEGDDAMTYCRPVTKTKHNGQESNDEDIAGPGSESAEIGSPAEADALRLRLVASSRKQAEFWYSEASSAAMRGDHSLAEGYKGRADEFRRRADDLQGR